FMPLFNSVTTSIHGTENNDLSEPSSTMDVASSLMDKNGCEMGMMLTDLMNEDLMNEDLINMDFI
ncbi:hypothetical protein, partial [Candidatus Ichthyocystis hellenicum]|uniref:hypothetical protein n=1 Tax=Candidatus Ichthyocystis hellenicum TaxID=1561003 RepID=UPI0015845826